MQNTEISKAARVSEVVEPLHGKWTVSILCVMGVQPVRVSELNRKIPRASKKALAADPAMIGDQVRKKSQLLG